jgi:hypothetical protein
MILSELNTEFACSDVYADIFLVLNFCCSDIEGKKNIKTTSTSQVSGKRRPDNIEVAPPAAKRQALELSKGSPKVSSPKKLVPLSRESSFKSSDKLKGKSGLLMPPRNHSGGDDTQTARSPSIGLRGQISKSTCSFICCASLEFFIILSLDFEIFQVAG